MATEWDVPQESLQKVEPREISMAPRLSGECIVRTLHKSLLDPAAPVTEEQLEGIEDNIGNLSYAIEGEFDKRRETVTYSVAQWADNSVEAMKILLTEATTHEEREHIRTFMRTLGADVLYVETEHGTLITNEDEAKRSFTEDMYFGLGLHKENYIQRMVDVLSDRYLEDGSMDGEERLRRGMETTASYWNNFFTQDLSTVFTVAVEQKIAHHQGRLTFTEVTQSPLQESELPVLSQVAELLEEYPKQETLVEMIDRVVAQETVEFAVEAESEEPGSSSEESEIAVSDVDKPEKAISASERPEQISAAVPHYAEFANGLVDAWHTNSQEAKRSVTNALVQFGMIPDAEQSGQLDFSTMQFGELPMLARGLFRGSLFLKDLDEDAVIHVEELATEVLAHEVSSQLKEEFSDLTLIGRRDQLSRDDIWDILYRMHKVLPPFNSQDPNATGSFMKPSLLIEELPFYWQLQYIALLIRNKLKARDAMAQVALPPVMPPPMMRQRVSSVFLLKDDEEAATNSLFRTDHRVTPPLQAIRR